MKRVRLLVLLASAVLGLAAVASAQSGGLGPPPFPNAMNDGCQRSNTGLVTDTSPSWVYVNRDPAPKLVSGVVGNTKVSHDDLNLNHSTYDFNTDLTPDAAYTNLVAGDPGGKTGNFQPSSEQKPGTLHVERELGSFPFFAWPHDGDRVAMWGGWIWDCAHWSPGVISGPRDPGQPGEKTEIHPIRAIVVTRKDGYLANKGQTQADAFISSNGTFARAEEKCALQHAPVDSDHYDPGFTSCKNDPANRADPVNDTDYTFFIPAPAHKPAGARLKFNVRRRQADNAPAPVVTTKTSPPGIEVTIPFKSRGGAANGSFARTFFVFWSKPPAHPPAHFAVKIESYKSLKAMDPHPGHLGETSKPPDEDVVTLDVNGLWSLLDRFAPKLLKISKGQTVKIGKTFDIFTSRRLTINVNGQECDSSGVLPPCPVRPGETGLANDNLGEKTQKLSLRRAPGRHTIRSPLGTFVLTYSVKKIP
jgi:hypothetical protein